MHAYLAISSTNQTWDRNYILPSFASAQPIRCSYSHLKLHYYHKDKIIHKIWFTINRGGDEP